MYQYQNVDDINVLRNKPGRVFLDSGGDSRAFDNVWRTNEIFIFKGQSSGLLLFRLLIPFQTSVESSTVRVSSENLFKANLAGGVAWGLSPRYGHL